MKEVFDALLPIKQSTGLNIDLYNETGELLFTTDEESPGYAFKYHSEADFNGPVILDIENDLTYFRIKARSNILVGVIMGSNEVSRNYAVMVSKLIEKTITSGNLSFDKESWFKLWLGGELNAAQTEQLKKNFSKNNYSYYVLSIVAAPEKKLPELTEFLKTLSESGDIVTQTDSKTVVFIRKCGQNDEYSSANDFAHILYENIVEEIRMTVKINVGGVAHSFEEIAVSYENSLFAYNFGILLNPLSNVYSYKEHIMIKMISDIPKESLSQYLDTLLDKSSLSILKDEELISTADAFMKNSLNISETSRSMYMHRNTLIYRLDKIESATGLNIRYFNDALIFKLITILDKLLMKD